MTPRVGLCESGLSTTQGGGRSQGTQGSIRSLERKGPGQRGQVSSVHWGFSEVWRHDLVRLINLPITQTEETGGLRS